MADAKRSLTTGEMARICGVAHRTVLRWIQSDRLKAYQLPGRGDNRILVEDCVRFLQEYGIPVPRELESAVPILQRVLVVDDDELVVRAAERALRKHHVEVEAAYDGFEVGAKLGSFKPDVLLLDLNIPGLNGFEVLRFLRSSDEYKDIKVLVISRAWEEHLAKAEEEGADAVLAKPFTGKELIAKLDELVPLPR